MAVKELFNSRKLHVTHEARTIVKKYACTTADWANGGDSNITFPNIGDEFSDDNDDLRVTDITVDWRDNTNIFVNITYSTRGFFSHSNRADKISSIVDSFDMNVSVESADKTFTNFAGVIVDWPALWAAQGGSNTVDNAPPLAKYVPDVVWRQKMYVTEWNFDEMSAMVGTINATPFLPDYTTSTYVYTQGSGNQTVIASNSDVHKWLFAGFQTTDVGYQRQEITMTFLFNRKGWNTPYGFQTVMYIQADFGVLPRPNNEDDTWDLGIRTE